MIYVSKEVSMNAIQWVCDPIDNDINNKEKIDAFCGDVSVQKVSQFTLLTKRGSLVLSPGDYIIKDSDGNINIVDAASFEAIWKQGLGGELQSDQGI